MNLRNELRSVHRIARINYGPRVLGFLASFVAVILLYLERELGPWTLIMATATFLVYPQLALLHTVLVSDSKRAEKRNLLLDCLLLGGWSAAMGFHLWVTFALFTSATLNNAVNGGLAGVLRAILLFATGSLGWIAWSGWHLDLYSGPLITGFVITTTLLYLLGVGLTFYQQNRQLAKAHYEIASKNRIFRSLLDMGMVTFEAGDIAGLLKSTLRRFRNLFPRSSFGVVLREKNRPKVIRHAVFAGFPRDEQARVIAKIPEYRPADSQLDELEVADGDLPLYSFPMRKHLTHCEGFLVVKRRKVKREFASTVQIFLDQLAAALENQFLTLELRKAAETDSLTGLFNRHYFEEQLALAIDNKRNHKHLDFAVVMIDVIGLKQVNDTWGHAAGDQLICNVADRMQETCRDSDILARFGGDEFVILCRACNRQAAALVLERIRSSCTGGPGEVELPDGRRQELPLHISIGVASSEDHRPEKILQAADEQMYASKESWYETHRRSR